MAGEMQQDNGFLSELVAKKCVVTIFVKNGVRMKGVITSLYKDYLRFETITQGNTVTGVDYIRYDAISTIHTNVM